MQRSTCPPAARRRAARLRAMALAAIIACAGEPAGVTRPADVLTARLVSPNGTEGAALIALDAAAASVTATDATVLTWREADALYVLVARFPAGELAFDVALADASRRPAARILQVADGENRLRASLEGYSLELRP